jgi:hypothetical protein
LSFDALEISDQWVREVFHPHSVVAVAVSG